MQVPAFQTDVGDWVKPSRSVGRTIRRMKTQCQAQETDDTARATLPTLLLLLLLVPVIVLVGAA